MKQKLLAAAENLATLAGHSLRVVSRRATITAGAFFAGTATVFWGVHDVYPPAAKILLGVLLLFAAWDVSR